MRVEAKPETQSDCQPSDPSLSNLSTILPRLFAVSKNNLFKLVKFQIILLYIVHFLLNGIISNDFIPNILIGSVFIFCLFLCIQDSITALIHQLSYAFYLAFVVLFFSHGDFCHTIGPYLPQLSLLLSNNIAFAVFLQCSMYLINTFSYFAKYTQTELSTSTILILALILIVRILKEGNFREEKLKAEVDSANAMLKETQVQLDDSIKFNKSFHLTISHEFRNPLNIIMGNLDLIQRKSLLDDTSQDHLKMARLGCETLLNSLNNTLDYCKAEYDDLDINYISVNIRKTFEKIWGVCSELLSLKNLQGELYLHTNVPPMIMIDTARLHQIILNLVHNSSKFTQKGFVKIVVSWHSCFDANNPITSSAFNSSSRLPSQASQMSISNNNAKKTNTPEKIKVGSPELHPMLDEDFAEYPPNSQKITFSPSMSYNKLDLYTKRFPKTHKRIIPISSGEGLGYLKIQVIDSGIGIHYSNLPRLFQKFSKFSNDSVERVEGSGLGLWVTKKICAKMEGTIHVNSNLNKGSTFLVFLKCEISPQSLGTPTSSPIYATRRDRANIQTMASMPFMLNSSSTKKDGIYTVKKDEPLKEEKKLTAMVVEDLPYNQQLNKQFLELCGVEVNYLAKNGLEALKRIMVSETEQFDLIFMDLDMPVMDGKTSSTKIREWEAKHNLKPAIIVILTGNCSESELNLCLDKNGPIKADYFFRKPLPFTDCQNLIRLIKREKTKKKKLLNNLLKLPDYLLVYEKDLFQQVLLENYLRIGQIKYYTANKTNIIEKFVNSFDTICAVMYNCEDDNMAEYKHVVSQIKTYCAKKGRKSIPIIGVVTKTNTSQIAQLKEIGFADFLIKPFDYENTLKLVKSHSQVMF